MTGMPSPIAFADLQEQYRRHKAQIDGRMQAVLDHGQFIMGPEIGELERRLSDLTGAAHVIAVSSGTDALLVPLMAYGIGPGDAVFVPDFTFTATPEVVALLGATPVFVEVDPNDFTLDPADLRRRIERVAARGDLVPRAIIAVDLFGLPADYPEIMAIARTHDLHVVADAAQSLGGEMDGRQVGALAPVTATSFFPAKPLGCYGDGGAIFTDDPELAAAARSIRAHGKGSGKYDTVRVGLNARLDTLQAAILLAKLDFFAEEIDARRRLAAAYDAKLPAAATRPGRRDGRQSAWAQYTIRIDDRDRVMSELTARGIPSAIYYPRPLHAQQAYRELAAETDGLSVAARLCDQVLSLPLHPYLTDEQLDRVCAQIRDVAHGGT